MDAAAVRASITISHTTYFGRATKHQAIGGPVEVDALEENRLVVEMERQAGGMQSEAAEQDLIEA
jgi:hypothetical protein